MVQRWQSQGWGRDGLIHTWFSFVVLTFCKLTMNADLVNAELLLPGERQGRVTAASGHIFINWSILNPVLCMSLLKDSLFNICCWLINTYLLTTAAELTPEQSSPSAPKAHPASSHSAGLDRTSAICLGAIINSEITNKKHKTLKMMALNRPWKGHWLTVGELKQKGRAALPYLSGERVSGDSVFRHSACLWVTMKEPQEVILSYKHILASRLIYK